MRRDLLVLWRATLLLFFLPSFPSLLGGLLMLGRDWRKLIEVVGAESRVGFGGFLLMALGVVEILHLLLLLLLIVSLSPHVLVDDVVEPFNLEGQHHEFDPAHSQFLPFDGQCLVLGILLELHI